jgi:hypothetical protein
MKFAIFRFTICLGFLFLSSKGLAFDDFLNEQDSMQIENGYNVDTYEFYVTADQIILCSEGIFVNLENIGILPIYSLIQIGSNLYSVKTTCPKHG